MTLHIDHEYTIDLLQKLVQINSVNSDLVPGAAGEGEIADFIADELQKLGVTVEIQDIEAGRKNVIGILKGGSGRSLMLNAHTDTVGIDGMDEPLSGAIRDGKLYGRGSFDMKCSIAACMGILKAYQDAGVQPGGDIIFTGVIDEEYGSKGTDAILEKYSADACIVTEPTGLKVCMAHRGFVWIEVITTGRAAHGSRYFEGIDANVEMGRFLVALDEHNTDLINRDKHPLLGTGSIHAPLLKGGSSQSVYAAQCRMELERRTLPGETPEMVLSEIQSILDNLAAKHPKFNATANLLFHRDAFEVNADAAIVKSVNQAVEAQSGQAPQHYGELWWMDSALTAAAGIETVIIGPTGDGAHADEEWVNVNSVIDLGEILLHVVDDFCD
ncbi:MAG: ArgE/DapE family deacylase [Aggregatilineales bacterium]